MALERLIKLLSSAPADRFGLSPPKGRIEVGADADLALVALDEQYTLREEDLRYRHRASPYAGREMRGRVVRTISRGRTVFRDGEDLVEAGGRLLAPSKKSKA